MLSLVLAVAIGIRPVRTIPAVNTGADAVRIAFAHDDQFEYLGTPAGLYRSRRFADPAETATVDLALSGASGSAWSDESASLPAGTKNVAALAESADGTLLAVLQTASEYTIAAIDVSVRPKRRAIRR